MACPGHQSGHLGFARLVVISLDENQTFAVGFGGVFKLQLRRRLVILVLPSVLVAENTKVNIPLFDLAQVDIVRLAVPGGMSSNRNTSEMNRLSRASCVMKSFTARRSAASSF